MEKAKLLGLFFAIATAIFWGLYGPALGKARTPGETPFKPYVFIGLAYLIWGLIGGIAAVKLSGESLSFKPESIRWGFIAGTLGAFGALTLTMAMFQAKDARLVMPVVFGGATAISAITAAILAKQSHVPPLQILGFALVIVGIVLIQRTAIHGPSPKKSAPTENVAAVTADPGRSSH